tara:strand:+ start:25 stop:369 length:345 start_codon:yes stop_codon:yes gene_type:complete
MKKPVKMANGKWKVGNQVFKHLIGSRRQVMSGTAYKTNHGAIKGKGGDALIKKHLKYNKSGKIVSRAKSGKKNQLLKQLRDAGYTTKKGKFGAVKIKATRKKSNKKRRRKTQKN